MTRSPIVVAAGINNELGSNEFSAVERLKQAGYPLELLYYLPRVPAEFSMIPSCNEQLISWRHHGMTILNKLGNKYDIPEKHRHFVDEILGPDRVFDEAKTMQASAILTHDREQLKKTFLSNFFDRISALWKGERVKAVPIENLMDFVTRELGPAKPKVISDKQPVNDDRITKTTWGKEHPSKKRGAAGR